MERDPTMMQAGMDFLSRAVNRCRAWLLVAAMVIAPHTVMADATQTDCVLDWAERTYPTLFSPAGAPTLNQPPYSYRHYTVPEAFLGTSSADNHLYYLGPLSERALRDVGPLATWASTANCASPLTSVIPSPLTTPGAFKGNVVLASPTTESIIANVYASDQTGTVIIAYGKSPNGYDRQALGSLSADKPLELALSGLESNTAYYYRLYFQAATGGGYSAGDEYSFHTARPAGSTFTFAIQGDSHPERERVMFNATLYNRTLLAAAADKPDFYVTMGDDFSVDTLDATTINEAQVRGRYTLQRPYLGQMGRSAPLFLVNGNHEQAARYLLDGTPNNVAVWAQNARNSLYSQPAPGGFYSGNEEQVAHIGLLRNYYAWTWGDALFVTLDPYWSSPVAVDNSFGGDTKRPNLWSVTHGDAQYQWLKATLEQSKAKYKFVFAHHVLGTQRGGIEVAGQYEWGDTTRAFTANRPGWTSPIHQLMVANRVTIFFQGHDHIWVRQQLDGVTYQTLSVPADPNYALDNDAAYRSGDKFPNSGYTRVTVAPTGVKVDYVRTYLPADEGPGKTSGTVAFSYTLP